VNLVLSIILQVKKNNVLVALVNLQILYQLIQRGADFIKFLSDSLVMEQI